MKPRSGAQRQRQDLEFRENGKYSKVNPCQGCGKSAGINYSSHPLTDCGEWDDHAICLCRRCASETSIMTELEDFLEYQKNHGGSR